MDDRVELETTERARASASVAVAVRVLDALPGAFERAELGRLQAQAGQIVPLDALKG